MRHHPDDAQALVLNHILAMRKDSPESHAAHRDYQETRAALIRPKLLQQRALLTKAVGMTDAEAAASGIDAKVSELDQAIVADWFALDARLCPAPEVRT